MSPARRKGGSEMSAIDTLTDGRLELARERIGSALWEIRAYGTRAISFGFGGEEEFEAYSRERLKGAEKGLVEALEALR